MTTRYGQHQAIGLTKSLDVVLDLAKITSSSMTHHGIATAKTCRWITGICGQHPRQTQKMQTPAPAASPAGEGLRRKSTRCISAQGR